MLHTNGEGAKTNVASGVEQQWNEWDRETIAQQIEKDIQDWLVSGNIENAKRKWVWELLQNAIDAARDADQRHLEMWLEQDDSDVLFAHTGALGVFTNEEFYRLLTRSTTKRRPDAQSEGRFGEGFVVTHILSRKVRVAGAIAEDGRGYRHFDVEIDRGGTWEAVKDNLERVRSSVLDIPIETELAISRATFRYVGVCEHTEPALNRGLNDLETAVQYTLAVAYARYGLAITLHVALGNTKVTYCTAPEDCSTEQDGQVRTVTVAVRRNGFSDSESRSMVLWRTGNAGHYLIVPVVLASRAVDVPAPGDDWSVPRLLTLCPLLNTTDIPVRCVVAGTLDSLGATGWCVGTDRFDVDYGHDGTTTGLARDTHDVSEIWRWLTERGYSQTHRLLAVARADRKDGAKWWNENLKDLAEGFCGLPAVDSVPTHDTDADSASVPARTHPAETVFPALPEVAEGLGHGVNDELVRDAWLLGRAAGLKVPAEACAHDWHELARGWAELGAEVARRDLEWFVARVGQHENIDGLTGDMELPGLLDSREATGEFLGLLVEAFMHYKQVHKATPDFMSTAKVYCSQTGQLLDSTSGLHVEQQEGISAETKEVAEKTGSKLQAGLIIEPQARGRRRSWCTDSLHLAELDERGAVGRVMSDLQKAHETNDCTEEAAVAFLVFMFRRSLGSATPPVDVDWNAVPIVTKSSEVVTLKEKSLPRLLAPELLLDGDLTKHLCLFSTKLVMSGSYVGHLRADERAPFGEFLVNAGLASLDGFFQEEVELNPGDVLALTESGFNEEHSFTTVSLPSVVGLKQILGGAVGDPRSSKPADTLRFLLEYVAPKAPDWRAPKSITSGCTTHRRECNVSLYPAEWLRRVKLDSWVRNAATGKGETPNGDNLEALLGLVPESLNSEPARRLLQHLRCDPLNLEIVRFAGGDSVKRESARKRLAEIAAGAKSEADLTQIQQMWAKHQQTAISVNKNHALGEVVQMAVAAALRTKGMKIEEIEVTNLAGRDLSSYGRQVSIDMDDEDILVQVGPDARVATWIEVKSATTDNVKMSMCQARSAAGLNPEHTGPYYLCVVDFRKLTVVRDDVVCEVLATGEEEGAKAECARRLAPDIVNGMRFSRVRSAIEPRFKDLDTLADDTTGSGVTVEPGASPRFVVNSSLWWNAGQTLDDWVSDQPVVRMPAENDTSIVQTNPDPRGGKDDSA